VSALKPDPGYAGPHAWHVHACIGRLDRQRSTNPCIRADVDSAITWREHPPAVHSVVYVDCADGSICKHTCRRLLA
jgi:hypothetical protein